MPATLPLALGTAILDRCASFARTAPPARIAHDQRPQFRRAAALGGAHGRDRERDIAPVLAGLLHDLGAADEFERGLALARAGIEPRIVERRPARAAHRVADAEGRRANRRSAARSMRTSILRGGLALQRALDPRDLAIDLALLQLALADRAVGGARSRPRRRRSRAPFGERPRLAFLAEAERRSRGEALGEALRAVAAAILSSSAARSSFSASSASRVRARSPGARRAADAHRSRRW